jgi:hypothetical protein
MAYSVFPPRPALGNPVITGRLSAMIARRCQCAHHRTRCFRRDKARRDRVLESPQWRAEVAMAGEAVGKFS